MTVLPSPAVFLDRDGTLNEDVDYVFRRDQWTWLPGAVDAIKTFNALGLKTVVVTNQSGVARGYFTLADVDKLHAFVKKNLAAHGARLDAIYVCPHGPGGGCDCRKPAPGLLLRAAREMGLDLARSFLIGDKASDIEAGAAAGARPLLVLTGYGAGEKSKMPPGVPVMPDLAAAARWIEKNRP